MHQPKLGWCLVDLPCLLETGYWRIRLLRCVIFIHIVKNNRASHPRSIFWFNISIYIHDQYFYTFKWQLLLREIFIRGWYLFNNCILSTFKNYCIKIVRIFYRYISEFFTMSPTIVNEQTQITNPGAKLNICKHLNTETALLLFPLS